MNNKSTEKKSSRNLVERLLQQVNEEDVSEEERMRCKRAVERQNKLIQEKILTTHKEHLSSLSADEIRECTWDSLDVSDPNVLNMAKTVRAWRPHLDHGLMLFGPAGTGKTHMLKSLIIDTCSQDKRFLFVSMSNFMITAKEYVSQYFHARAYIDYLSNNYYAVVLDDLGTEKANDFQQEVLFLLIERFKKEKKKIFMTSNLTGKELAERYHERILSRLGEVMVFLESQKKSYRKTIHNQNRQAYFKNLKLVPSSK